LIKGTVEKTFEKDWVGNDGKVVLCSFQIQGDKRYFRTGTSKLVSRGDAVQFEVGNNNNVVEDSLVKLEASTQTAPPVASATGGGGGRQWGGKPKTTENFEARQAYWENKERRDIEVVEPRITWSSARTAAIEVVGLALQHDLLVFGNANKSAKLDLLLGYVDRVAGRFYAQSMDAARTASGLTETDMEAAAPSGD
jgi:hypothetical protein